MKIKSITLENMRAFEKATFEFGHGMNLIVGVNGVGKSTVLDALRICFSRVLPMFSVPVGKPIPIDGADIRSRASGLYLKLVLEIEGIDFVYQLDFPRLQFEEVAENKGKVRGQTKATPRNELLEPPAKALQYEREHHLFETPPLLAVYFSPRRSSMVRRLSSKLPTTRQIEEEPTGFDRALLARELNLSDFTDWWFRARQLSSPWGDVQLHALEQAMQTFLSDYHDLKPGGTNGLYIKKGRVMLDVARLSDGEKSVLALVIELTRRLSQANPNVKDPSVEAGAVVLIDELDLHLHPLWQREIVEKLTRTFPKCQFICTTHSPQIIGEVIPERVTFITAAHEPAKEDQTKGLESGWILENMMGAPTRNERTRKLIAAVEDAIDDENFTEARKQLAVLRDEIRGSDPETVRLGTMINTLSLQDDETDTED
ncbi:MAG TPA: AAA family ATPase [Hymenobacter sp.]|uniref:AAA family ATPase n=1 Tax=Hymenobacter sp. TaxID=1898978 RepID=UPI002D802776|nr:AAA family ATPase [Hymenobacter sp.]HET9505368.1 AAA family ATPase [Hymenobacter sp.]